MLDDIVIPYGRDISSYGEGNVTGYKSLYSGSLVCYGSSIYNVRYSGTLHRLGVLLKYIGDGSQTGNITIKIYGHTGTYGTSSTPTGALLATSAALPAEDLTSSGVIYYFPFMDSNRIALSAYTYYTFVVCYSGGNASNHIGVGYDDTTLGFTGNAFSSTDGSSWTAISAEDCIFYVYVYDTLADMETRIKAIESYLGLT